ncbi:folate family ECF transporter S component [Streptococcus macacae]|uniref:Folate family ECF transporter S component n=1 Tax=Streptococcus macacae NCTC 11558 TaxID=764298 RepID=G5JUV1_9STRE|nr:folate family ECF transporter S component [Streptococcus macacae]EHJ53334.1 hypothetical protein STRMA_1091 [Streptococcus macacae NCTC 11558]SUN78916.1 membrane protein [Streptococcus macacae NCTC 11558]
MKIKTPKLTVHLMTAIAVLLALNFILGKFSFGNKLLQISPNFIDNTIIGSIAGPVISFFTLGLWDIISFLLSGKGDFIIWFTLIEALQGFMYGYFFYGKEIKVNQWRDWVYVSLASLINLAVSTFFLTPLALHWYYKIPFIALYAARAVKILELPIRIIVTMLIMPQLQRIPELRKLMGIK